MAALAYVLLPLTGVLTFLLSGSARAKSHGLQAIVLGTLWPVMLYAASALMAVLTWVTAVAGAVTWLAFMVLTASGRDPKLPFIGQWLFEANEENVSNGG